MIQWIQSTDESWSPWDSQGEALLQSLRKITSVRVCAPSLANKDGPAICFNDRHVHLVPEGVPVYTWAHNLPNSIGYDNVARDAYRRCERVFASSFHASVSLPDVPTALVGFPVANRFTDMLPERKNPSIDFLVPGRIDVDRMPLTIAHALLQRTQHTGERIVFCTSQQQAHLAEVLEDMGVEVKLSVTPEDYKNLLAETSTVVIGSTEDSLNISAVEAIFSGARVIAPDHGPFKEYVFSQSRYSRCSVSSILYAVAHGKRSPKMKAWRLTCPGRVAENIMATIQGGRF